jgi:hypothetical protein
MKLAPPQSYQVASPELPHCSRRSDQLALFASRERCLFYSPATGEPEKSPTVNRRLSS